MPFLAPTFSVREGPLAFGQPRPIHKAVHPFFSPLTIRRESGGCILHSPATGKWLRISSLVMQIDLWLKKVSSANLAMFGNLNKYLDENEMVADDRMLDEIKQ